MIRREIEKRLKNISSLWRLYVPLRKRLAVVRSFVATSLMALARPVYGLCREKRDVPVVVSMASYKKRFPAVHIALKSILRQTVKPDKIILNVDKEDEPFLPKKVLDLQAFGVEIKARDEHIRPNTKWFGAFKENPDSAIITVDDDMIYPKTMIEELLDSYKKHPDCVSARFVTPIKKDGAGKLKKFTDWGSGYEKLPDEPSNALYVLNVGGALYPPPNKTFDAEVFNLESIRQNAITNDDLWLKFMELRCGVKCVHVPCKRWATGIYSKALRGTGLYLVDALQGGNDICIEKMQKAYNISLADFAIEE